MQASFSRMNMNDQQKFKKNIVCFTCNKEGHKSVNCWKNKKNEKSEKYWCSLCKSSTHSDKYCRRRKQNFDQAKQVRDDRINVNREETIEFSFCCKQLQR